MKSVEFLKQTVCVALALWAFPAATLPAEELNTIILRVNDEITTLYDYRQRKEARERAIAESEIAPEERRTLTEDAGRATMREILDEMLLLSRARQLIIEPSKAELDEAMDATRSRMNLATEAAFANALKSAGMTLADFRERTSRSIRVNGVIQREVRSKVEVDDEWLQRTYRERLEEFRIPAKAKVQEIVIPAEKLSGDKAREVAEAMRVVQLDQLGKGRRVGAGRRARAGARGRGRGARGRRGLLAGRSARRPASAAGSGAHREHGPAVGGGQGRARRQGAEPPLRREDAHLPRGSGGPGLSAREHSAGGDRLSRGAA